MSESERRIAGHVFTETPDRGRACSCGRRWVDIAGSTRDDIGRPDIAHYGALSEAEFAGIEAERDRLWTISMGSRP
jgi:hypothetical protein